MLLIWLVGFWLVTPTDPRHDGVYDYTEFVKNGGFHTRAWLDDRVEPPVDDKGQQDRER